MEMLNRFKKLIKKILPCFLISWYHFFLAFFGAFIYRFPSKKMKIIGVTGTNGKTTVVKMISKILEQGGYKIASFSSIELKIGKKEEENVLRMTMPGRFKLQRFLRQALNKGCQYVVLEVSSEGIKQHRHRFIDFNMAVFTNLTPEHIEAHGSFEKYRQAKGKLFQAVKDIHVLNLDDKNIDYFLNFRAGKKYGYSLSAKLQQAGADDKALSHKIIVSDYKTDTRGITFKIGDIVFDIKLLGDFNIYNALAAICVGLSQDIDLETCKNALEKIKGMPGRMEMVISEPFKVIVDYAFTPNALEKVYQTIKNNFNPKKLICVLGASGGGRDKWKRPILGELAAKYCSDIIVTNEDPHDEDPMDIINQVAGGAGSRAKKILDRREAIRNSLRSARTRDVVVITGKGCEPCIYISKYKKMPWDDREVVREEFEKLD